MRILLSVSLVLMVATVSLWGQNSRNFNRLYPFSMTATINPAVTGQFLDRNPNGHIFLRLESNSLFDVVSLRSQRINSDN